jgi:hypothetical protein
VHLQSLVWSAQAGQVTKLLSAADDESETNALRGDWHTRLPKELLTFLSRKHRE